MRGCPRRRDKAGSILDEKKCNISGDNKNAPAFGWGDFLSYFTYPEEASYSLGDMISFWNQDNPNFSEPLSGQE